VTGRESRFGILSLNDYYPERDRTVAKYLTDLLSQIKLADRMTFWGYFVQEHHLWASGSTRVGPIPNPSVLLAAASRETRRIALGPAVSVLPLHDPLLVAEDYALLDQLCGGRLELGVGSGYRPYEFEGLGIDVQSKGQRLEEALNVIEKAWKGERFSHAGRYYNYRDVRLNVTPRRKAVPVWVAALTVGALAHLASQGRSVLFAPYATLDHMSQVGPIARMFHEEAMKQSLPTQPMFTLACHMVVAPNRSSALERARDPVTRYFSDGVAPELYTGKTDGRAHHTAQERIASGLLIVGDPDDVASRLRELRGVGVDRFLTVHNFGDMPHEYVTESMELLNSSVIPRVD
jgi:alkanesulfonate monooxygenase SsuD/methylene tetrahydromethanopterin reductase-like flavin-dependent oxidoreductase (luciferase family)